MKSLYSWNLAVILAALLGAFAGWAQVPYCAGLAQAISDVFMQLLQLVAGPLIFLSLLATLATMQGKELKVMGRRVIQYTLLTTWVAATIALGLFIWIAPAGPVGQVSELAPASVGYWEHLKTVVPSNVFEPFLSGNVMSLLFLAVLLGAALLKLPDEQRLPLSKLISSLFAVVMAVARMIVKVMPVAVWAFALIFVRDVHKDTFAETIGYYLLCVVLANTVQAVVVLPLLVWLRGGQPLVLLRAMLPALAVAFFSKSSSAALPVVMQCAEERLGMRPRVSRFAFPLCVTVNMNACAAFILITVLFVSMSNGIAFSPWELAGWTLMATLAAVGNAGVPMGCFMLASAFLATMGVPVEMMALILPVYALLDMMETAINVWSDSCVAHIVDREVSI